MRILHERVRSRIGFAVKRDKTLSFICSFRELSLSELAAFPSFGSYFETSVTGETMLNGEYRHVIDPKKRLSLPSKFRKEIGRKIVITRGLDNCLFVYPIKEWERVVEKLKQLPMGQADMRGFNRFMSGGAVDMEIDSLGRILLPDFLKKFAHLKDTVVLIGMNDRLEIWDESAWNIYKKRIEKQADVLAEKLGEVGAI